MRRPASHRRLIALQATVLATTLAGAIAHAEPAAPLDRVSVAVGAFSAKPKIHVSGDTNYGYLDSGDQEYGHTTLPRVKAEFLLGDSHGLALDYFRYDKDYNPSYSGATTDNGQPLTGTATVNGKLRLDLAQLAYRWWMGQGDDVFGVGVGAAYLHGKLSGSVTGQVSGLNASTVPINFNGSDSVSAKGFAPLIEFGWKHAFQPNLRMFAEASGLKKNGGSVDGHVYGGNIGVEWFAARNVGLVVDYGIQRIQLSRNNDQGADLKLRLTGPSAFVKVRF